MPAEHTSLASNPAGALVSKTPTYEHLFLITGPNGAGKTTWCQSAARQAQAAVLRVAGLIAPAVFEGGYKVGIDVIDLKTGQRRNLATRRQPDPENACNWRFIPETVAWANQCLRAVSSRDILFIDELGPLELVRGEGFQVGLMLIDEGRFSQAYVVLRPSLLALALKRWPGAHVLRLGDRLP